MRNMILSLVVACGLLLVGPAAYAKVDGSCQSIGAMSIGLVNQIDQGINVVENCFAFLDVTIEFMAASCDTVDDTAVGPILENGASCNIVATLCDGIWTCFEMVPDYCVDVPDCTIP